MSQLNGHAPQTVVVGEISIKVTNDGQMGVNVAGNLDQLSLFAILGQAQALLAQKYKQEAAQQIQAAPPGLVNRLIQG